MESIKAIMPFKKHKSNFGANVKRDSGRNRGVDTGIKTSKYK